MIFYILAGYLSLWSYFEKRSIVYMAASMVLWSAALISKNQTLPFWAVSMLAILFVASVRRDSFILRSSLSIFVGTIIAWRLMLRIQHGLETNLLLYGAPMQGLLEVTGWVPVWEIRLQALSFIAKAALPLLFGLVYTFFLEKAKWKSGGDPEPLFYLRLGYWSFICSWLLWFATLAMPWNRYLYPPVFLGSVFVAALVVRLTDGLRIQRVIDSTGTMLRKLQVNFDGLAALFCIVLISYMATIMLRNAIHTTPNDDAEKVSQYLNQATPADASIETYDSELLLLVQRRFHYPPDQIQVELNKRAFLHQQVEIPYDPMQADPDYIVIGPYSNSWSLYNSTVLRQDTWKLIYELPSYKVYEQVR